MIDKVIESLPKSSLLIQHLSARHYRILDYVLVGLPNSKIAEKLNISSRLVRLVVRSPTFQHELAIRRQKVDGLVDIKVANDIDETAKALKDAGLKAAQKLIGCLDSGDENIQLKSATDILDRTGYPKATKQVGVVGGTNIIIDEKIGSLIIESLEMDS